MINFRIANDIPLPSLKSYNDHEHSTLRFLEKRLLSLDLGDPLMGKKISVMTISPILQTGHLLISLPVVIKINA